MQKHGIRIALHLGHLYTGLSLRSPLMSNIGMLYY